MNNKFRAQAANAKWKQNQAMTYQPINPYRDHGLTKAGVVHKDTAVITHTLARKDFDSFVIQAYANKEGYAIRINPITGEKEMMIAGTRTKQDWASNAIETLENKVLGTPYTPWRSKATRKYERIAKKEGIDIVYGHSRGGAIVADMNVPATKVGLDAAMVLASNKELWNLNEGGTRVTGLFDRGIGLTGRNNESLDLGKGIHKVWT